jgi:hypothetical protein
MRLRSDAGQWIGVARLAPMKARHLQAYWPETNVLIPRRFDPVSGEPDYNCLVTVERVEGGTEEPIERVRSMRAQAAPAG